MPTNSPTSHSLPEWLRAHGEPLFSAQLRTEPADFQVTELLGWEMSGDGEHDYLYIEKTGANTDWVAEQLASFAGVPAKEVGYAGLKDRHAVTWQWFSVPRWHSPDWSGLAIEGVRVLDVKRHLRKLRRGAHDGNQFRILLRHDNPLDREAVQGRLATIGERGVPNYFGEQRFGRNGNNLRLAEDWANGRRLSRNKRSLAISVARSWLFNNALSHRVEAQTWNQLVAGDKANLEGSASIFDVPEVDAELSARCHTMDIHPAGTLAGDGTAMGPERWQTAFQRGRVEPGSRSLRLRVADLEGKFTDAGLELNFTLTRGAFATSVLRELCIW